MRILTRLEGLHRRLTEAWHNRAIMRKAVSFATIGVINTAIDFGVFNFAYYYLGWPIVVANPLGWILAVTNSYVMNSLITFAAESGRQLRVRDYAAFAASMFAGLVANTATVLVLVLSGFLEAWQAKIPAIGVSFLVDFSLSHFVVFRRSEQKTQQ
jgi:putative flippase GtrA